MTFPVDTKLHWTDHYVEHGFAVIKHAAGDEFIKPALVEVEKLIGNGLPLNQWTVDNAATRGPRPVKEIPALAAVYDQPGVRSVIDAMFGSPLEWNGERAFQLFVSPFDPKAKAEVTHDGHIDFVNSPVPIFGSGVMFQLSLVKSEHCSGNISIFPGTHKIIQRMLADNPDLRYPADFQEVTKGVPFEFVAEPGDMMVFHHLVGHAGNANHAAGRSPRVVLHCQANRHHWLRELDPADPKLSPWQRSLAFTGGRYRTRQDEEEWIMSFHREQAERRKANPQAKAM